MRCRPYLIVVVSALAAGCAGAPPGADMPPGDCVARGPDIAGARLPGLVCCVTPDDDAPVADATGIRRMYRSWQYPTVVQVDCDGRLMDGLCERPRMDGRRASLEFPSGLLLHDGRALDADAVARYWGDAIRRGAGVDSVRVTGERTLDVYLERPDPRTLASLDFGIPLRTYPGRDAVRFSGTSSQTGHETTDIFFESDPDAAAYAREDGAIVVSLPFDRTYLLLTPAPGDDDEGSLASLRDDLARVVRDASVRAADTPPWWREDLDGCGPLSSTPPGMNRPVVPAGADAVIYYAMGDGVALDLAQRIVALSLMDPALSDAAGALRALFPAWSERSLIAIGLEPADFDERLQRGDGLAFVASVPNPVADACGAGRRVMRRAPWLAADDPLLPARMTALVDAQSFVGLTRGRVTIRWDRYATVRVVPESP